MVWTSNLAYVIGLITTDGCLSPDGRHITFTSTDRQLIETFVNCLNLTCKIGNAPKGGYPSKKKAYRVQFSNVKLYRWLLKIGLSPNKSRYLGSLKINQKYFKDFLRGHLDGDGSIIQYKDRYLTKLNSKYVYNRLFIYFISASIKHIEWLSSQITLLIKLKGSISKNIDPRPSKNGATLYRLKFSTKEAKKLLNWIYYKPNLPRLERKFKKAKPFVEKQ